MASILTGIATPLEGMRRGIEGLNKVAAQVAAPSVDAAQAPALASNVVQSIEYSNAIEAAAQAVQASNSALGSLLDVLV